MLQAIVNFSLRYRGIVLALACLLVAYGVYTAAHAKLDVFPNFVPPEVTVQTEAPGLTPEQVETMVTRPIESAINGLGNQEALRSESIQGLSVVTIVFKEGTDVLQARQMLAEKLGEVAGGLPAGVNAPTMSPLTSATMDLLKIGLVSDKLTPMELRTFVDWTLKPKLLSVPGVAHSNVFGGEVRQWQIQVHPDLLVAANVTLADVIAAARLASGVRGAGYVDTPNQRIVIESDGQTVTPAALAEIVVTTSPGGVPIRLRDVAAVIEGAAPKFGDALIQGRPGVLLTTVSQYGANTMEATRGLEAALEDFKPEFARQGITLYPAMHRPATFITTSIDNISHSLLVGAVLVSVILFVLLWSFRTALISITAIPLSLLGAIIVLDRFGITLNTITLGGLAIALGEVVDDAIIDVENILRRLRENRASANPKSPIEVILAASVEVRSAIVYATFVVALVFLPILTLGGISGAFFAPLARSYILAIMTSLGVALTVTPALTLVLFPRGAKDHGVPRLQRFLRAAYERILHSVNRHPVVLVTTVAIFCVFILLRLPYLGGELLPEFREGHFVVGVSTSAGSSLTETLRIGKRISDHMLAIPNIATVEQQVGRAESGEDTWGPHKSEFHVELKAGLSGKEMADVEEGIRTVLEDTPGISSEVVTFLGDRINETITGEKSPVVVNLFGDDLDALDLKADEIKNVLSGIDGAEDVQVKTPALAPRIGIRLRADRLAQLGFRPVEVLEAVQAAYEGEIASQVYRGSQKIDIAVVLDAQSRGDPDTVGDLLLTSATGGRVPLREVADVYLAAGRDSIFHDAARRLQTITATPVGRDVASFMVDVRAQIAQKIQPKLPRGMSIEYAGTAEADTAATRELLLHGAIAFVGIVMLLSVVLGHWRNLLLVLVNLPLALAGGVLAVYFTGALETGADPVTVVRSFFHFGAAEPIASLTMGSRVGFVTLFGITTRNAIMLISHYEHLVELEGQPWNLATAVRGASERLIPIIMTASVTALGLFPLALGSGEAGREIEGPMAVVILGGLVTSATLNLLVLPTLALRFGRFGKKPRPA